MSLATRYAPLIWLIPLGVPTQARGDCGGPKTHDVTALAEHSAECAELARALEQVAVNCTTGDGKWMETPFCPGFVDTCKRLGERTHAHQLNEVAVSDMQQSFRGSSFHINPNLLGEIPREFSCEHSSRTTILTQAAYRKKIAARHRELLEEHKNYEHWLFALGTQCHNEQTEKERAEQRRRQQEASEEQVRRERARIEQERLRQERARRRDDMRASDRQQDHLRAAQDRLNRINQAERAVRSVGDAVLRAVEAEQQRDDQRQAERRQALIDRQAQAEEEEEQRETREQRRAQAEEEERRAAEARRIEHQHRKASLEAQPRAILEVTTDPVGAEIVVETDFEKMTDSGSSKPPTFSLLADREASVRVSARGRVSEAQTVALRAGETASVTVSLGLQPPRFRIEARCVGDPRVAIFLDGARVEREGTEFNATLRTTAGRHVVRIEGDGCIPREAAITTAAGQEPDEWPRIGDDLQRSVAGQIRKWEGPASRKSNSSLALSFNALFPGRSSYAAAGAMLGVSLTGTVLSSDWFRWNFDLGYAASPGRVPPSSGGASLIDLRALNLTSHFIARIPIAYLAVLIGAGIGYRYSFPDGHGTAAPVQHTIDVPFSVGIEVDPICHLGVVASGGYVVAPLGPSHFPFFSVSVGWYPNRSCAPVRRLHVFRDTVPVGTLSGPATASTPQRKPVYKRWWFWTGVGAIVSVAAIGTAIGVAAQSPANYGRVTF